MADRSGPKDGYDFGNKRQYRRNVWNVFNLFCGINSAGSQALIMPSLEGDEIDVALAKGFKEHNISICDRNPAIVATLKRKYRNIQTYGVNVAKAAERRSKAGLLWDVANLDLCGCIGEAQYEEVRQFGVSGAIKCGIVAVSMLRGREKPKFFQQINHAKDAHLTSPTEHLKPSDRVWDGELPQGENDFGRIVLCAKALSGDKIHDEDSGGFRKVNAVYISRWGKYKSTAGNQTMLWACYKVHAQPCACNLCLLTYRDRFQHRTGHAWDIQDILYLMQEFYHMSAEEILAVTDDRMAMQPEKRLKINGGRSPIKIGVL